MSGQLRIPLVVITSFFHSLSKALLKTAELPSLVFLISPCPHSRVYLQYRSIVQINSQTRRSNSSQFSWLLVVWNNNLDLLLSVVLLKPIHAMTFRTKFLLFVSICFPPNNPITACGATSFPGYHSFPKWAMGSLSSLWVAHVGAQAQAASPRNQEHKPTTRDFLGASSPDSFPQDLFALRRSDRTFVSEASSLQAMRAVFSYTFLLVVRSSYENNMSQATVQSFMSNWGILWKQLEARRGYNKDPGIVSKHVWEREGRVEDPNHRSPWYLKQKKLISNNLSMFPRV